MNRLILFLVLLLSTGVSAEIDLTKPSYNYVSLEYEVADDHDGSNAVTYGFCFEPVKDHDWLHIFGGWQEGNLDLSMGVRAKREGYLVGGGFKHYLNERSTVHARIGYVDSTTRIRGVRIPTPGGGD